MPDGAARQHAGDATAVDGEAAIHEDVLHPRREHRRAHVGRAIGESRGIERDHVSIAADRHHTTTGQLQRLRRELARGVNGLGESQHVVVEHVLPQLARKGAVLARMPIRPVGASHHPRLHHEGTEVRLLHVEGGDPCITGNDDVQRGVDR